ncbi:1-deoxy-D-xylulose-5-phosphate synthase [Desulforamulus hydrothermalis]|uniref:1-deoxy-D-xylulose-5-phosphate synthase n=1 Tax=Desulforamulus hydrothermalis Lam5 = DSM 18033 TaxID=1121428 RepID=K8E0A4_9FIRM|nr:1-deoxy-D-xylulose-5-phosphate synthase [Desulforamulus hydrothermalis]CCO08927.1 1-deoxy-D-xylulose-5-phosphate synthase [Desulforamulus hydrothermalis Lam5 = DSM 18033]SHG74965.1 1-deoxy-D-xylulose-5-phosphate synthase [Desulforamulus hydrothermalis Lam5 = DSM 18033]
MTSLLKNIYSPQDLQNLSLKQLEELAAEIRQRIIETVSVTGGHLAPNLGVVELTLALHRVFNSAVDRIIWDVGHQSYVHKLLTGRQNRFASLRQYGGISGFPKPAESIHDAFATGHSSTSVSAALGMALARDLNGATYDVVAVIGDGSLTGGMAFEAMNHAGHLKTNVIVVLNDNEMSIAPNVGALSGYLSRLRTDPKYSKSKDEIAELLQKLPHGNKLLKVVDRLKDSLKYLVVPGMLFEELGFTYLGPVDGHDIKAVMTLLQQAKSVNGPVLVHVLTRKGKGYWPAEENPDRFHGVGPFDVATGRVKKAGGAPSYTEVFGQTLVKLARQDSKIIGITAAMPSGTGLQDFAREFPRRYFDVGIAEQHAVTMAAGLATAGYRPVAAIYSTFLQRAYDQVLHDVCLQNLPVTFALDRGGLVGDDGPTHHGVFDIAYLRHIPNMVIMSPKDENELQHMLKTAVTHNGPVAVRYPRGQGLGVPLDQEMHCLPIGRAEVLRDGSDLLLLAVGNMVAEAMAAAEELSRQGITAAVINARYVKPLDEELILAYAGKTKNVITIEEHVLMGGFGSAVVELLQQAGLPDVQVKRIGLPDEFVEHGKQSLLRQQYGLTAEGIVEAALAWGKDVKKVRKLKAIRAKG